VTVPGEEDVFRLQITVGDSLVGGRADAAHDLLSRLNRPAHGQGTETPPLTQGLALQRKRGILAQGDCTPLVEIFENLQEPGYRLLPARDDLYDKLSRKRAALPVQCHNKFLDLQDKCRSNI